MMNGSWSWSLDSPDPSGYHSSREPRIKTKNHFCSATSISGAVPQRLSWTEPAPVQRAGHRPEACGRTPYGVCHPLGSGTTSLETGPPQNLEERSWLHEQTGKKKVSTSVNKQLLQTFYFHFLAFLLHEPVWFFFSKHVLDSAHAGFLSSEELQQTDHSCQPFIQENPWFLCESLVLTSTLKLHLITPHLRPRWRQMWTTSGLCCHLTGKSRAAFVNQELPEYKDDCFTQEAILEKLASTVICSGSFHMIVFCVTNAAVLGIMAVTTVTVLSVSGQRGAALPGPYRHLISKNNFWAKSESVSSCLTAS